MKEYSNVLVFSTKPREEIVSYSSVSYKFPLQKKISQLVDEACTVVDIWDIGSEPQRHLKGIISLNQSSKKTHIKSLLRDFVHQMDDFGLYAASVAIMSPIIDIEIKLRQVETLKLRNLYGTVICICEYIRHIIVTEIKHFYDEVCECVGFETVDVIMKFSTRKLISFLSYLKKTFSNKQRNDICCLVFVQRRYTAKCLLHVLEKYLQHSADLQKIITPQFVIGRISITTGIENILDRKRNKKAIEQFLRKECNLIICSNVLEEGIDIQACNFVFAFDPLTPFSSYIQTKGRARSNDLQKIITPQFVIGRISITTGIENILDRKRNKKAIEQFLRKECNLIICSNVLEEGIDIQACNFVFAFDPLTPFSSYIQTKGRARSNDSAYALFTSELDEKNMVDQVNMFRYIHKIIKNYLMDRVYGVLFENCFHQ